MKFLKAEIISLIQNLQFFFYVVKHIHIFLIYFFRKSHVGQPYPVALQNTVHSENYFFCLGAVGAYHQIESGQVFQVKILVNHELKMIIDISRYKKVLNYCAKI